MSAMTCRFKSGLGYHLHIYFLRGISSDGRAPALHAGGQRFDPAMLHHLELILLTFRYAFVTIVKQLNIAGWSSLVARWAHNPEVESSNLSPATILKKTRSGGVGVNMPACHAGDRGFNSRPDRHFFNGSVAQSVEQWTENPCVEGSIPPRTTI